MSHANAQQRFLDAYEREHATTRRVLEAYPPEQADLRPHPRLKTAKELAWMFVLERGLGQRAMSGAFAAGAPAPGGRLPPPPATWEELLAALEAAHREFAELVRSYSPEEFQQTVQFLRGPQTLGDWTREEFAWFLLYDQIHHRGQFSIYLRLAGGRVPSIYGPSGDEPWT